jgi:plastocyanin
MRRAVIGALIGLGLAAVPAIPAGASGGGGCGSAVSEAAGDNVAIRQFCFEPTVLVVPAGSEVSFTNEDPVPHNVLGANATWGTFARMGEGKTRTYTFTEPGVYPFVCTWHPGMVGALLVGDRAGSGETLDARRAVSATGGGPGPWKIVAVAAGALLVLTVMGTAGLRRRTEDHPA